MKKILINLSAALILCVFFSGCDSLSETINSNKKLLEFKALSNIDFIVLPTPSAPTITPGDGKLIVTWTIPDDPVGEYYEVWFNNVNNRATATQFTGDPVDYDTTCIITGLTNGITYYVWIKIRYNLQSAFGPSASGIPVSAPPPDLDDGLVAEWLFNGDTLDTSGNDHHGTGTNVSMVPDRNGIANNACYLNGTSSYITINTINDAYVDGFSISVWVYITEAQGEYARILDFGNGSYSDNICLYFIWSNYLTYQGYNAASVAGGRGIGDLTHNAWHHVCITSDSSGNISAYLDGLTDGTSLTGVLRNVVRTSNFIGRSNWAGEPLFKGYLDNMRFYNRALTANEVLQLFSNDQL